MKDTKKQQKILDVKKKNFGMENCKVCGDSWRYNFEREMETTRPQYLMSIWFNKKSFIEKITKKRKQRFLGRENSRTYICIDCALSVNDSLMKHLKNFKMAKMGLEDEMYITDTKK